MERGAAPRTLPRGPHNLTRDDILTSPRERMIDAMADCVAGKSYGATTVGDVISGAGVSRKTFYEHFDDKEDYFLAAFDAGVDRLLSAIASAAPERSGLARADARRVRAYLVTLADNPAFARTFLLEVFAAGPRAIERRAECTGALSSSCATCAPTRGGSSRTCRRSPTRRVASMARRRARRAARPRGPH